MEQHSGSASSAVGNCGGNSSESRKWDRWGTTGYSVLPHVSPESERIGATYRLRPTDVVVLTFPKTGTTFTQTICEQLRTNAEGYDGFDEITERQPWLEFAHDLGQDLDDDHHGRAPSNGSPPALHPRVFKSHQLPSAINPGGKYLSIVRDPSSTLLSWFHFQKVKGRPGYSECEDANQLIRDRPELFNGKHIFGTNVWEYYTELWSARFDPSIKILVYERLVADASNGYGDYLPLVACFLGIEHRPSTDLFDKVAKLVSRTEMLKHVDKFDDHFMTERGKQFGRANRVMDTSPKVKSQDSKHRTKLTEASLKWLQDRWTEHVTPQTGHGTYDDFASDLTKILFANN